jgi:hypothetical protein
MDSFQNNARVIMVGTFYPLHADDFMTDDISKIESVLIAYLRDTMGVELPIEADETALFQDLGVYGDDWDEFFEWVEEEFRVTLTGPPIEYAPGEPHLFTPFIAVFSALSGRPATFPRLTVRDVAVAIQARLFPAGSGSLD